MTTAASLKLKSLKFRRCLLFFYLVLLQFTAANNASVTDGALTPSEKDNANFAVECGFTKTSSGFEKMDRAIPSTEKYAEESNNLHDNTENPNLYLAEKKDQKKKSAIELVIETVTYVVCALSLAGILVLNSLYLLHLLTNNGFAKGTSQNWSNLSSSSQMTIMALSLLLFHAPVGGDVPGMSVSKGTYFQNEAQGRYLQGYISESFSHISMFQCQIQCVNRLPKCRSINYIGNEDGSSICEINKETQYCALPGEFILRGKSFYLETMPETDDEGWCSTCNYSGVIVKTNEAPGFTCSCKEGFYGDKCQHKGNPGASKTVYYKISDGWILVARYSNKDARNWINVTGHWWYDKVSSSGAVLDPSDNSDMISEAFWKVRGNELKITRSDDASHTPLLQTTTNCLDGQSIRGKIISYGNFQGGSSWAKDSCRGNCQVSYGGQYLSTAGFEKHSCNAKGGIQNGSYVGFWCHWSADGAIIMIGGGGSTCDRADHGIGITEQDSAVFVETRPLYQDDFGFYQPTGTGVQQVMSYSLNLWVR